MRLTACARERAMTFMPRRRKTSSSTPAASAHHTAARAGDGGGDVVRLGEGETLDAAVDLAEVDAVHAGGMLAGMCVVLDEDAELLVGGVEIRHDLGGRDQRLRRHAVG